MQHHFMGKIESAIYFTFVVVLLFEFFNYALLCNLIPLANILVNMKQASRNIFKGINKTILLLVKKML